MQTPASRTPGFTLIELLIAMAILSTLACIALPSWQAMSQSIGSKSARSALSVALNQARIAAVTRGNDVVVCPSVDQLRCDAEITWHHGWIVFADANHNHLREEDEPALSVGDQQPRGIAIVSSSGRRYVRFQSDGSAGGSNLTLTFCDRRGAASASTLVINNAGRLRGGSADQDEAAAACSAIDS